MKVIVTKWHPCTATRPSRVSASDNDGNRVYVPCAGSGPAANELSDHEAAVRKLCLKMDWHGRLVCGSLLGVGQVWVWGQEGLQVASEIVV